MICPTNVSIVTDGIVANARDVSTIFLAGSTFVWSLVFMNFVKGEKFKAFGFEFDLKYRTLAVVAYTIVATFFCYKFLSSLEWIQCLSMAQRNDLFAKLTIGGPILFTGLAPASSANAMLWLTIVKSATWPINLMVLGLSLFLVSELNRYGKSSILSYFTVALAAFNWLTGARVMNEIAKMGAG